MSKHQDRSTWTDVELARELRLTIEQWVDGKGSPGNLKRSLLDRDELLRTMAMVPPVRGEVLGEASPYRPAEYHLDCLAHLDWSTAENRRKVLYHLKLLACLIDPLEPTFQPKVSVIVVVRDARDRMERTLASIARQSYRSVEVIVVDDGSTDGTPTLVASLPTRVRLIHQEALGRRVALERALSESTGEFVQFVHAGEELDPSAIEDKLAVWLVMPEARLCLSESASSVDGLAIFDPPAWEDARSMLGDPLLCATSRMPFVLSSALIPRWFIDQTAPLDGEIEPIESVRMGIRVGRHGVRVAAVAKTLVRRFAPLKCDEGTLLSAAIDADLVSMRELAGEPRHYRYLAPLSARVTWMMDRSFDLGISHERIESWDQQVTEWESTVGNENRDHAGTTAILLDQIQVMLKQKCELTEDPTRPTLRLWMDRQDRLAERIGEVKYVTGSDLRRWLPDLPPRPFRDFTRPDRTALKFGLEQLQVSLVLGDLPIRFRSLERVAADYPGHPYERYWFSVFRLARLVGDETARSVFRQKLVRRGWEWMGRAKRAVVPREAV
jgi:glycosyltransferase involved in cell wall biosynthesis